MSELGIPGYIKPCGHSAPTFGCLGCIKTNESKWMEETYAKFLKAFVPTKKCCGLWVRPYAYYMHDGKLWASLGCHNYHDGEYCCSESDCELEIA